MDLIKHLDEDRIIGDFISQDKYKFADKDLISEVVRDTFRIINEVRLSGSDRMQKRQAGREKERTGHE